MNHGRSILLLLAVPLALLLAACGAGGNGAPSANTPPVADAGPDEWTRAGMALTLDGSGSQDPDGDDVTHRWSVTRKPAGSLAPLEGERASRAVLTPDVAGEYLLTLVVSDGAAEASDRIRVTTVANGLPVAAAGPDRVVRPGDEVKLDAAGSSDPDGDALAYSWEVVAAPSGSSVALDDPRSRTPSFTPATAGEYTLKLVVTDGSERIEDTVTVRVNRPPTADAGPDRTAHATNRVYVDASASSDPDAGDALTYAWALISQPASSHVVLDDAREATASFVPQVWGDYVLELTVGDGVSTASDLLVISVAGAGGATSSTLHVAPSGDDADAGTEEAPLRTLARAVERANGDADVRRVLLAPGEYTPGATFVGAPLQIVGPDPADGVATVTSYRNLFVVGDGVDLSLARLTLQAAESAVLVGAGAGAMLDDVTCTAFACVRTTGAGATIGVVGSHFTNAVTGIRAEGAERVSLSGGTVIDGSMVAVDAVDSVLGMRETTITGSATGLRIANAGVPEAAFVGSGTVFDGNDVGVHSIGAANVRLDGIEVRASATVGVWVQDGGAVRLEGVAIRGGGDDGLVVGRGGSAGEVVTVRGSVIEFHAGRGISIEGARSSLDLGNERAAGGNESVVNTDGDFVDARPDGAEGRVTLRATVVGKFEPGSKTYSGPIAFEDGITILGANDVIAF